MASLVRQQQGIQTLVENCTKSYAKSTSFMKQLTVIAISTITYIRKMYDEDNYNTQYFHGLKLNILKSKCKDEHAQKLSDAINSTFEAIDKKYLDELALLFYVGDPLPENVVESFRFKYSYSKRGCPFTMITKNKSGMEETKKIDVKTIQMSTMSMLQYCQRALTTPLTNDLNLTVKVCYNSDTSKGYQVPGFKPAPSIFDHFEQQISNGDHTHMEEIKTPFHKLDMKCWVNNAVNASYDAEPSTSKGNLSNASSEIAFVTRCNCRATPSDIEFGRKLEMIQCNYCTYWQHAICYGYLAPSSLTTHCCYRCALDHPERTPTDPKLQDIDRQDSAARRNLCITRRTLEWCTHIEHVSLNSIMEQWGIFEREAALLLNQLKVIGVIMECDSRESMTHQTKYRIVQQNLNKSLQRVFHNFDESNYSSTSDNIRTPSPTIPCPARKILKASNFSYNLNKSPTIDTIDPFDDFMNPEPCTLQKPNDTHGIVKMMHGLSSTHLTPQKRYNTNYPKETIIKIRKL